MSISNDPNSIGQYYEQFIHNFEDERKIITKYLRFVQFNQEDYHSLTWQEKSVRKQLYKVT